MMKWQKMKNKMAELLETFIVWTVTILVLVFGIYTQDADAAPVEDVIIQDIAAYNGNSAQIYWISDAICYAASLYQVDPLLVTAVMETESHFSFDTFYSTSSAGAIGFMQLMPDTARSVGVDPYDPLGNIIGGTAYLRYMLDDFSGCGQYAVTNAVAAYNAGPAAVTSYGGCPPYSETQNYVIKVSEAYNRLLSEMYR